MKKYNIWSLDLYDDDPLSTTALTNPVLRRCFVGSGGIQTSVGTQPAPGVAGMPAGGYRI